MVADIPAGVCSWNAEARLDDATHANPSNSRAVATHANTGAAARPSMGHAMQTALASREATRFAHLQPIAPDAIATRAVAALIDEACLTPKPALVDRRGSGAHRDLSLDIMLRSAKALHPRLSPSLARRPISTRRRRYANSLHVSAAKARLR